MENLRNDRDFALELDRQDPLASYRDAFLFPKKKDGEPVIYLCGNSLGLQPKRVQACLQEELDKWHTFGVEGHFEEPHPWYSYHEVFQQSAAHIGGGQPSEFVVMNSLTVNLHLAMVSFYRPTPERYKIVIEGGAFPSDRYAVGSQAHFHGYSFEDAIVELQPREGEYCLRTEDIEAYFAEHGHEVALSMLSGVNFYTGQVFDMERITKAAHDAGCVVGFDLAHAAGNVPLKLHDWGVDFAAWCSYKYLNSGPGGVAFFFVHERHEKNPDLPRFAGWWGNDPQTRFEMGPRFEPHTGAAGWQLSNAPILSMASLRASMELFDEVGMEKLRDKSLKLTTYLLGLIDDISTDAFEIITPREDAARGSQLSIRVKQNTKVLFESLQKNDVICDVRGDVIRIAPAPLYNSFLDCWTFCQILRECVS